MYGRSKKILEIFFFHFDIYTHYNSVVCQTMLSYYNNINTVHYLLVAGSRLNYPHLRDLRLQLVPLDSKPSPYVTSSVQTANKHLTCYTDTIRPTCTITS